MSKSVESTGYKNISPAKKLRSLRRLIAFRRNKTNQSITLPSLQICAQENVSFLPTKPKLGLSILASTSTPVQSVNHNLSISPVRSLSIPPKKIYHPAIINVCQSLFEKHPDNLQPEEILKFHQYKNWKLEKGEPIEEDLMYLPCGGMKGCLHCKPHKSVNLQPCPSEKSSC